MVQHYLSLPELMEELEVLLADKLFAIVCDDDEWHPEARDNVGQQISIMTMQTANLSKYTNHLKYLASFTY